MTVRAWAYVGPYFTQQLPPAVVGPPASVSQAVLEVMVQPSAQAARVSQVVIEVLLKP